MLLHSNPLFFVGYSIRDPDLVRILRQLYLRRERTGTASNVFALIDKKVNSWPDCLAEQIRSGVNLITYDRQTCPLSNALTKERKAYEESRRDWRRQPKAKRVSTNGLSVIEPRTQSTAYEDPLLSPKPLMDDPFLSSIAKLLDDDKRPLSALVGPGGSAKLLKVSQLVRTLSDRFTCLLFNSHNNDDIYSYLKRIIQGVTAKTPHFVPTSNKIRDQLQEILATKHEKPLLLIISAVDLFLDFDGNVEEHCAAYDSALKSNHSALIDQPDASSAGLDQSTGSKTPESNRTPPTYSAHWEARNKAAQAFHDVLVQWGKNESRNRVLMTARVLPGELTKVTRAVFVNSFTPGTCSFTKDQLGLSNDEQYRKLTWHLQDQNAALVIASAYISSDHDASNGQSGDLQDIKLKKLLQVLAAHVSERGTRVIRYIVRELDKGGQSRPYERLLTYISCFNTPIAQPVLQACADLVQADFNLAESPDWKALVRLCLLEQIRADGLEPASTEPVYVVPSVVKRYCRTILTGSHYPDRRACGVHGLLSRGPFNNPGTSKRALQLFEHFSCLAFKAISNLFGFEAAPPREDKSVEHRNLAEAKNARWFTRASLDILRSNFCCNSVPTWGSFREYIDMCTMCLDNINNLARILGKTWLPDDGVGDCLDDVGTASPEELIFLYNELGLAYYDEGSVQDALSVWGLAFEWQKAMSRTDPEQSVMYAASLHSHVAMANLQMGRMEAATESIKQAQVAAHHNGNRDLEIRLHGLLARVDHFRGNLPRARLVYEQVIEDLGRIGNRRAQSYFMRHLASLFIRLKEYGKAEELARLSLAIAAGENSFDFVAFSRHLLGNVFDKKKMPTDAIKSYRIALEQARALGIARLQADILLGLASVQLTLGDSGAARDRAIGALKLANENLLVLRQIKSLLILGQAIADSGNVRLGACYLSHAKTLARDAKFFLTEHDVDDALAALEIRKG